MADINTVSLSGVLTSEVQTSKAKGVPVARFFLDVEGAGDQRPRGNFKVVAFAEWAEAARKLSPGDRVVLVGALLERRGRGRREMEVRVRNLIPLLKEPPQVEAELPIVEAEEEEEDEEEV
jgi:single-stranded DNA-binding protein